MEKKINLNNILNNILEISKTDSLTTVSRDSILEAMLETIKQSLELAYDNSKIDKQSLEEFEIRDWNILNDKNFYEVSIRGEHCIFSINKQSILDTITQVEV